MNQRYLCAVQEPLSDTLQLLVANDSIIVAVEQPTISLFEGHELQTESSLSLREKADTSTESAFLVLFICIAVLIYLHRNSEGFFTSLFKAGFDSNLAAQNARVENSQRSRSSMIVQIVAIASISLFVSGILLFWRSGSQQLLTHLLSIAAVISLGMLVKRSALWLLATLFDLSGELRFFRFNLNTFLSLTGLILLPLSLMLFYSPQIPTEIIGYVGLGVVAFFYLKGLQRGLSIAISSPAISSMHLFYYLCALEILPLFVLIKIMQNV